MATVAGLPTWAALIVLSCVVVIVAFLAYYAWAIHQERRFRGSSLAAHDRKLSASLRSPPPSYGPGKVIYDRMRLAKTPFLTRKTSLSPEKRVSVFGSVPTDAPEELPLPLFEETTPVGVVLSAAGAAGAVSDDFARVTDPQAASYNEPRSNQRIAPSFICPITQEISASRKHTA